VEPTEELLIMKDLLNSLAELKVVRKKLADMPFSLERDKAINDLDLVKMMWKIRLNSEYGHIKTIPIPDGLTISDLVLEPKGWSGNLQPGFGVMIPYPEVDSITQESKASTPAPSQIVSTICLKSNLPTPTALPAILPSSRLAR
jgi:hypothetical protein